MLGALLLRGGVAALVGRYHCLLVASLGVSASVVGEITLGCVVLWSAARDDLIMQSSHKLCNSRTPFLL